MKALERKLTVAAVSDDNPSMIMLATRVPVSQMEWLKATADRFGLSVSLVVRLIIAEARDNLDGGGAK